MAAKLSDPMITTLLNALLRPSRTEDGTTVYQVQGNAGTLKSLATRGKVENSTRNVTAPRLNDGRSHWSTGTWLTEGGITFLREAMTYVMATPGSDRPEVYRDWLAADRNATAVARFLDGGVTVEETAPAAVEITPKKIRLQGIGFVPAVEAREVKVGDTIMWNYGSKSEVTKIEKVSPAFLRVSLRGEDGKDQTPRKWKGTSLVARVEPPKMLRDYRQGADELLGAGMDFLRHWSHSDDTATIPVDREGALNIITLALRHGDWQCYRADAGGVNLESPTGESSYWLEPVSAPVAEIPDPRPAAAFPGDPIAPGASVYENMPGRAVDSVRDVPPADTYVVQIRDGGQWITPNHDNPAYVTRADVAGVVRYMRDRRHYTRFSVTNDGTLYVSDGRQAARYAPAELLTDYDPAQCPGCGTDVGNDEGPCPGRPVVVPVFTREPSRGGQYCGHQITVGRMSDEFCADRKAPGLAMCQQHHDETAAEYGAVNMAPGNALGDPAAPLVEAWEPTTEEDTEHAYAAPAMDDDDVNLMIKFMPQDPADENTRPCVEVGTAQVYAYRKGGRLIVSVDTSGMDPQGDESAADGSVPMEITVNGNVVFTG